ncbi:hypothetical protein [Comamonas sp. GB3 AK4-5]|uniref:hypothetical protein n=1 Tax=Comamonas sp. GB3 AK4-5 TaxID=3231487 RepID=UPI00351DD9AB
MQLTENTFYSIRSRKPGLPDVEGHFLWDGDDAETLGTPHPKIHTGRLWNRQHLLLDSDLSENRAWQAIGDEYV